MSLPGLISLGSLPPHLFDAMFLNPRRWLPRNCSLFLISHLLTDSKVSYFLDGLQTSPLIRQVEGLKDVREWSIMPTHSLNGSLEVQGELAVMAAAGKGILQRLSEGPVIGDGGFLFELEKRGYITAGPFTPEVVVEHPEAVQQLHREFLRCGSDVMQAFTYYATEDKLTNRGQKLLDKHGQPIGVKAVNEAATRIAKEVAAEGDALTLGSLSQTPSYLAGKPKAQVQHEFRQQVKVFVDADLDFVLAEYFEHIEEMEWAIETCKESGKVVAATMCIGPEGDVTGVSAEECAVRMCRAGASLVGANCHFDPFISLKTMARMKAGLANAGLSPYLMCQPIGYLSPDAGKQGHIDLPEFPFALEPRIMTRFDAHRFAREAIDLGIHYIGGCCGFQPYHIRAMAEALREETGKYPEACKKHLPWGAGLEKHTKPWIRARASQKYWENLEPSTGRPFSRAFSKPDNWEVSKGEYHSK